MEEIRKFFSDFIEKKWDKTAVYDLAYFTNHYSIRYNVAQYYLRRAVYDGRLCCVKVKNKSYYMLAQWRDHFKVFEKQLDHVKVL